MIKTITISDKEIKFDTALSWMFIYRTQFGNDPVDIIMPAIKAAVPLFDNISGDFTAADIDMLTDVLSEINITEGLQMIWALARNANKDIDEPTVWYRAFDNFPLDEVLTEIVPALVESCISTKKYKALSQAMAKAVPKKKQTSKVSSQGA
jgi:hypothetical protein